MVCCHVLSLAGSVEGMQAAESGAKMDQIQGTSKPPNSYKYIINIL